MDRKLIVWIIMLFSLELMAQIPYAFNYQGVAKNSQGEPIANQQISILIELLEGSEDGTIEYGEEHKVTTNGNGLFSLQIGLGSSYIGNLRNIDWGNNRIFIYVEMDPEGGDNYQALGTTQLYSVPYALYAAKSGDSGDAGGNDDQTLQLSGSTLSIENGNSVDLSSIAVEGADEDPNNELQTLSLIGQNLSISNGNSVDLSSIARDDADADPQNELQTLSISGQTLSISGGNSVTLPNSGSGGTGTDDQNLSLSGTTLSIERGNSIDLSSLQDGVMDADADPSNELQSLTLSGNTLSLSGANSVTLPDAVSGDSYWESDGPFSIFYDGWIGLNFLDRRLIQLDDNSGNSGRLRIYGENGNQNVTLNNINDLPNHGFVGVSDPEGNNQSRMGVNEDGFGFFSAYGPNGNRNFRISSTLDNPNFGTLGLYNDQGESRIVMQVSDNGQGIFATYGPNGNRNSIISNLSTNRNYGYIGVVDSQDDVEAGMYVNSTGQGVVFADLKNFKTDHPKNNEMEIVYASIEGPEAAAYVRGTGKLVDGVASIDFPDYFSLIISGTEGMTVHITPLSAESKGIAVIKKGKSGFGVKELLGGNGTYEFDWEVKAVRAGYEDYKVVRNKNQDLPAETHEEAALDRPQINMPSKRRE